MNTNPAKVIAALCIVGVAACSGGDDATDLSAATATTVDRSTAIEKAVEDCIALTSVSTAGASELRSRIGDNGNTVTFDTQGADDFKGDSFEFVACALKYLEVTDFIIAQIDGTRALDGTQQAEWGDYRAIWTYHADNGLVITVGKV